jgi:hypothetical protein
MQILKAMYVVVFQIFACWRILLRNTHFFFFFFYLFFTIERINYAKPVVSCCANNNYKLAKISVWLVVVVVVEGKTA